MRKIVLLSVIVLLMTGFTARGQDGLGKLDPNIRVIREDAKASADGSTDWPMYLDPYLPELSQVYVFSVRLKPLWLEALEQPDLETRRRAADTIGQAHLMGMPGLIDTAPRLVKIMSDPQEHLIVRLAAARTLIRMNARDTAEALLQRNRADGSEMVLLTDPALAAWHFEPAYALWITRLADPKALGSVRASAIRSLQSANVEAAAEPLQTFVVDAKQSADLRLAAAEALGVACTSGLEALAQQLLNREIIDRLCAAQILAKHSSPETQAILVTLAQDTEAAVIAAALQRLLDIDPLLIKPIGNKLLLHPDAKVRWLAAQGVAAQRSPEAIAALAPLLNDIYPEARFEVRRQFILMDADPDLRPFVREQATQQLAGEDWRPAADDDRPALVESQWRRLEQAAMVMGAIDHEPAAQRLVELLEFPRNEVRVAAAAALRRLAVADVLDEMLAYAERAATLQKENPAFMQELDVQMAQLFQAFGQMRYQPADALLRLHVPKHSYGPEARTAAIWALGYIYEDNPQADLAEQMAERMMDSDIFDPEFTNVRRMSAVSIGRMRAAEHLDNLRLFAVELTSPEIGGGARWAVTRITGETFEEAPPQPVSQYNWFITPNDAKQGDETLRAAD